LFATLADVSPARVIMAHERELVPLQTAPADQDSADKRWPVAYAILFVTVASVALWSLIIAAASWLMG
jgi:hypothetical protein